MDRCSCLYVTSNTCGDINVRYVSGLILSVVHVVRERKAPKRSNKKQIKSGSDVKQIAHVGLTRLRNPPWQRKHRTLTSHLTITTHVGIKLISIQKQSVGASNGILLSPISVQYGSHNYIITIPAYTQIATITLPNSYNRKNTTLMGPLITNLLGQFVSRHGFASFVDVFICMYYDVT